MSAPGAAPGAAAPFAATEPQAPFDAPPPPDAADPRVDARSLDAATPDAAAVRTEAPLAFTGNGAEYFRIWVVNTTLTLLTLGVYSAWAKVRKASYFARNTRLLGDPFEFSANPWAILRGRALAVVLLGFYSFAFQFSLTLGLVSSALFVGLAPLLFASANRFRLHNTRWRGLRFGFTATLRGAYGAALLVALLWVAGTVTTAVGAATVGALATAGVVLLIPWMHHRIKAFQHRHAVFAGHRSSFAPALGRFYAIYAIAGLMLLVAGIVGALIGGGATFLIVRGGGGDPQVIGIILGLGVAALAYLAAWPLFAARMQRTVWERTRLGPYAFATRIAFRTLLPVAAKNGALLLLTAGLWWPFAAVALARYRIECMSVVSEVPLDAAVASIEDASPGTLGEGAADFFGIDIGW